MKFTRVEFEKLDFDSRCVYIEQIIPNDYFDGQLEIDFWVPPGFTGENGEDLPPTPPEITEVEEKKFIELIINLTNKVFTIYSEIVDEEDGKIWGKLIENGDVIMLYDENEPLMI